MTPKILKFSTLVFSRLRKFLASLIIITFTCSSIQTPALAQAAATPNMPWMPKPGVIVHLSPEFKPAHLVGMTIHADNALKFDFLINRGDSNLSDDQKQTEYNKLVKYFLASLTIADEDQWVNLSPYEKNRIIQDSFGNTEMGRDLLAQDYILKQITSSLIYPEDELGKKFWDKVYDRAWKEYGTTNVPVNTFNKVWIVPDEAAIYESGNTAYVLSNHLKVMLEEDYLSLEKHNGISNNSSVNQDSNKAHSVASQIIKEIILPELQKEINEGQNFANLRQIYSGMILATWYKKALKESLLGKVYANQAKVKGVDQDPKSNQEIYQQYLKAFKKGVFNYIKEDVDRFTQQPIPRKYFSGGTVKDYSMLAYYGPSNPPPLKLVSGAIIDSSKTDRVVVGISPSNERLNVGELLPDGSRKITNPDGSINITYADGSTRFINTDGDVFDTNKDGRTSRFFRALEPNGKDDNAMIVKEEIKLSPTNVYSIKNQYQGKRVEFSYVEPGKGPKKSARIVKQGKLEDLEYNDVNKTYTVKIFKQKQGVEEIIVSTAGFSNTLNHDPEMLILKEDRVVEEKFGTSLKKELVGADQALTVRAEGGQLLSNLNTFAQRVRAAMTQQGPGNASATDRTQELQPILIDLESLAAQAKAAVDNYDTMTGQIPSTVLEIDLSTPEVEGPVLKKKLDDLKSRLVPIQEQMRGKGISDVAMTATMIDVQDIKDVINKEKYTDDKLKAFKEFVFQITGIDDRRDFRRAFVEFLGLLNKETITLLSLKSLNIDPSDTIDAIVAKDGAINGMGVGVEREALFVMYDKSKDQVLDEKLVFYIPKDGAMTASVRKVLEQIKDDNSVGSTTTSFDSKLNEVFYPAGKFSRRGILIWENPANPLSLSRSEQVIADDVYRALQVIIQQLNKGGEIVFQGDLGAIEAMGISFPTDKPQPTRAEILKALDSAMTGRIGPGGDYWDMLRRVGAVDLGGLRGDNPNRNPSTRQQPEEQEVISLSQVGNVVELGAGKTAEITADFISITVNNGNFEDTFDKDTIVGVHSAFTGERTRTGRLFITAKDNDITLKFKKESDYAMGAKRDNLGGIDLNAANLNLQIKRDGKGVPLPLDQQDMNQLMQIQGFIPRILDITPAAGLPIYSELQGKLKTA